MQVSYAWPLIPTEAGLQERLLCMCEDLQSAGIDAFMDVTKGDSSTDFDISLPEWIRTCDFVVLVGTASFVARSKDPSTLTFIESIEIGKKKQLNSNSVIPLCFEGRFSSSFPPGYQDTIGGRCTLQTDYLKELPSVVAAILGVNQHADVAAWLDEYSKETQAIIGGVSLPASERDQAAANLATQQQYWRSCMLVLRAKLSLQQLRRLDGNVVKRTKQMDAYCAREIARLTDQCNALPPISHVVPQKDLPCLEGFFSTPTCQVLVVYSPYPSLIPGLFDSLALRAWQDNGMVPVFVDLGSIDAPTTKCVEKVLQKLGLDDSTIAQSKEERSFFILVSGFERCGIHTNFYVRNELSSWEGKVVFSCPAEYQQMNANMNFYFAPPSLKTHQLPHPEGLIAIILDEPVCSSPPCM